MKTMVRVACCCALVLFPFAATADSLWSQETAASRPAVVLSIASANRLVGDIGYLTRAAGWPQIGGFVTLLTTPYLQDLDAKSPAGMLVTLNGGEPSGVAFIGVGNYAGVLAKIEEQFGKPQDMGDGLLKLALQRDFFLKRQGNWVFIADKPAHLAQTPGDPSQFLGGLDKRYALALRVDVASIPPELKDALVAQFKADAERQVAREMAGKSAEERRKAEETVQRGVELLAELIQDAEQVTVGWGTDSQGGKTFLETSLAAREGTKLASHMARTAETPVRFSGVPLSDAAFSLAYNLAVPPQVLALALQAVNDAREQAWRAIDKDPRIPGAAAKAACQESAGALFDVLAASLQRGQLHGLVMARTASTALQVAAAGVVADGAKLEQALRKLAEVQGGLPGAPQISLDVQTRRDVDCHSVRIPIPEGNVPARRLFGPVLECALGTSADRVCLALGPDSLGALNNLIDAAETPSSVAGSPLSAAVAVAPLLALAQTLREDPTVAVMSRAVSRSPGRDHVAVTARSSARGVVYRLEIEEGVLSLIGEAAKLRATSGGEP